MPVLTPDNKYSCRINFALNFAQTHLSANLDALASSACISKFHFLRLFHGQVGESPVSFLKRIRLERAACLLAYAPNTKILDIASHCGFASSQHFTRSFADKFGRCPREYRSDRRFDSRINIDSLLQRFQRQGITYDQQSSDDQVKIVKSSPIRVAYVRNIGRYGGCKGIEKAFELIWRWAKGQNLLSKDTKFIGVSWDYSSLTPTMLRRYDACIQIPYDFSSTSKISTQTLPGGSYATMRTASWDNILLDWKLLDLTVGTSPRFKPYQYENNTGPWYEIFKPGTSDERSEIVLCSRLHPRTTTLEYT